MVRSRTLVLLDEASLSAVPMDCQDPGEVPLPGQPVAVALVDDETLVVQSREPAALT